VRQISAIRRLDRLLQQIASCEHVKIIVAARDRILSVQSVARIQTGLISCNISERQNKRKRQACAICPAAICRIVCLGLYTALRHSKTRFREMSKTTACISVLGPEIKLTTFFAGHIERTFRNEIFSSQLNIECLFAGLKGVKTFHQN